MNYVFDAVLKIQLDNFIAGSLVTKSLLLTSASLESTLEAYNLSVLETRLNDLKHLSKIYPTVAALSDRQMLSIEKGGERFMPLPMQMIAVERERFDIKEKLAKTQRQVEWLPNELAMLAAHEKTGQEINSGKALARALVKDLQARVPNAKQGYEMSALLGYEAYYSGILANSFTPSRFIVSPTLPVLPLRSPLKVTVLFGVLGGLFALLWQFRESIRELIRGGGDEEDANNIPVFSPKASRPRNV